MSRTSVRMLVRRGSIRSLAEGSYEPALAMFVRYAELTFPAPGRCRGSIMIPGLGGTPSLPTRAGAGSRPSSDATLSTGRRWRSRISRSAALRRTPGRQPGPPPDPRAGRQRHLRQPAVLMVRTARGRSAARTTTNTLSAVPAPEDPYAAAR